MNTRGSSAYGMTRSRRPWRQLGSFSQLLMGTRIWKADASSSRDDAPGTPGLSPGGTAPPRAPGPHGGAAGPGAPGPQGAAPCAAGPRGGAACPCAPWPQGGAACACALGSHGGAAAPCAPGSHGGAPGSRGPGGGGHAAAGPWAAAGPCAAAGAWPAAGTAGPHAAGSGAPGGPSTGVGPCSGWPATGLCTGGGGGAGLCTGGSGAGSGAAAAGLPWKGVRPGSTTAVAARVGPETGSSRSAGPCGEAKDSSTASRTTSRVTVRPPRDLGVLPGHRRIADHHIVVEAAPDPDGVARLEAVAPALVADLKLVHPLRLPGTGPPRRVGPVPLTAEDPPPDGTEIDRHRADSQPPARVHRLDALTVGPHGPGLRARVAQHHPARAG